MRVALADAEIDGRDILRSPSSCRLSWSGGVHGTEPGDDVYDSTEDAESRRSPAPVPPLCACDDHDHDDRRPSTEGLLESSSDSRPILCVSTTDPLLFTGGPSGSYSGWTLLLLLSSLDILRFVPSMFAAAEDGASDDRREFASTGLLCPSINSPSTP